ncbi:threonylcarbamoyl-AMP synthase [Clostridia bacterium]|nr:threonylcarbamoyl-AMP synthase [Clostridia bacterium]
MRAVRTEIIEADREGIERAARLIRTGGIAAFPTETVYGLGADAFDADAVQRIFTAKGRPADNPLIVHCADFGMVRRVALEIPLAVERLSAEFWPGPLTVVLKKRPEIPAAVTAGLSTVAVRIPAHPAALALIRAAGTPIAAPSANSSGRPSPTAARHVYDDLNGKIPLILDGGSCGVGVESTVLDLSGGEPVVLRQGGCPLERIEAALGQKVKTIGRENGAGETGQSAPKSPGMKYRHYAPACEVRTFGGGNVSEILKAHENCVQKNLKSAIITVEHRKNLYGDGRVLVLGRDAEEAARNLFRVFRDAEREYAVLLCEELPEDGLGAAVNDRMRCAAAGNELKNEN